MKKANSVKAAAKWMHLMNDSVIRPIFRKGRYSYDWFASITMM